MSDVMHRADTGCDPRDPLTHYLPWSASSYLPRLGRDQPNLTFLQPIARRTLRRCLIVADRHVHKNGGSTIRDVFLEHERQGLAIYHGYQHVAWSADSSALHAAAAVANPNTSHVLLVESHFGHTEFAGTVLPSLKSLSRTLAAQTGSSCPLVLITRVREPLDYYLSFYRWAVGFRQRDNPKFFGRSFLEWAQAVPNLQSTMVMHSMAAYHAEWSPRRFRTHWGEPAADASPGGRASRDARQPWHRLRSHLDRYAIVAPMARFDEAMVMLHDLTGLPLLLYRRNRPGQKGGFQATNADVCPDMEACRRMVASVAERDHRMYARYARRFEARLVGLGEPFARRVELYKRAVEAVQPVWKRAPRRQVLCRFQRGAKPREERPELHLKRIRCPFGADPSSQPQLGAEASPSARASARALAACASVYAHRLFDCPWQYTANSTLTDATGCWRPSSGVK